MLRTDSTDKAWESLKLLLLYTNSSLGRIGHLIYLFWILTLPSSIKDLRCLAQDIQIQ